MLSNTYWVEGPWAGRLAILARPRGGDWLVDEIRAWQSAGIDVVVSLLTADEVSEWELSEERALSERQGLEYISFPISDRGVPASHKATLELTKRLEADLAEGKRVGIHCRAGVGRSALVAAAVLVLSGLDVETAFERLCEARGCPVPDTREQRHWVAQFAQVIAEAHG